MTDPSQETRRGGPKRALALAAVGALVLGIGLVTTPALASLRGEAALDVRKDVKDLTAREKRDYVEAILAAKSSPAPGKPGISYYDQFVQWHRDAFRCRFGWQQGDNWAGAAHNSPTFLPWHREYLHRYELMLREVSGKDITLPYWDWTDPASTEAVFADDFMGGNGDPDQEYAVTTGPFAKGNWMITIQDPPSVIQGFTTPKPYLVRNFGAFFDAGIDLPTAREVREAAGVHRYDHAPFDAKSPVDDSFRNTIEGWRDAKRATCDDGWIDQSQESWGAHVLHNGVHIYVGGLWKDGDQMSMGTIAYNTSPNDPVFFLHHANVDRLWAAWELASRGHYRPQQGADDGFNGTDTMWPWFDRSINSWFGTLRNGYRYAKLPAVG